MDFNSFLGYEENSMLDQINLADSCWDYLHRFE